MWKAVGAGPQPACVVNLKSIGNQPDVLDVIPKWIHLDLLLKATRNLVNGVAELMIVALYQVAQNFEARPDLSSP